MKYYKHMQIEIEASKVLNELDLKKEEYFLSLSS